MEKFGDELCNVLLECWKADYPTFCEKLERWFENSIKELSLMYLKCEIGGFRFVEEEKRLIRLYENIKEVYEQVYDCN